jgi:hypothetical protein
MKGPDAPWLASFASQPTNGLQPCREFGLFFGLPAFINVDRHLPPAGFVHRPGAVAAPMANSFAPDKLRQASYALGKLRQAMLSQKVVQSHGSSPGPGRHDVIKNRSGVRRAAVGITLGFGRGHETLRIREPRGHLVFCIQGV